ncbi:MAG: DUF362 domain-containing protein [Candidatus Marinimicrobia bacterium]|nr:DUF362 domain-containing protein [Candidatus Neomarinimicrobiota bacterium]
MNNNHSIVAIVKCQTYTRENVQKAVRTGLELIGGLSTVFSNNEQQLLLKPNALSAKTPDKCVTTHPEVFRAVAQVLQESSFKLSYGDSSAVGKISSVFAKIGIKPVADALSIPLADFENERIVSFPEGHRIKQFKLVNAVSDCDAIVSLPKLKTHNLTRMTGAVKNQFGCILGFSKPEFHVKLPDAQHFSEMLVDLNHLLKPKLFVMDAIQSMEGNGPGSGDPVDTGLLLFSTDPVAMDSVACLIMNIQPDRVLTNKIGAETGLGNCDINRIRIVGDDWHQFVRKDFNIFRGPQIENGSSWKYRLARKLLTSKPVIDPKLCRKCNVCIEQCPVVPKALFWKNENRSCPPVYDYQKCIRCYCCQEVCPHGAISARMPLFRKIFDSVYPF